MLQIHMKLFFKKEPTRERRKQTLAEFMQLVHIYTVVNQ